MINKKCQVPTPSSIVDLMLDEAGYSHKLYGKKVLENSCGKGNILCKIVERYILDCLHSGYNNVSIREGLEKDVHGYELDKTLYHSCLDNLNKIAKKYGIDSVNWHVYCADALKQKGIKYHYIISNPPYLAYPDLSDKDRAYIRKHFTSCYKGKPDYYYAFIEAGLCSLHNDGKMVYLIPENFMKNLFADKLRELLLPHLKKVIDYTHKKIFDGILTSSVIIVCSFNISPIFQYTNQIKKTTINVNKDNIKRKWKFSFSSQPSNAVRFGEYFNASAPIATQLNHAFVINEWSYEGDYMCCGEYKVEKTLVRDAAGPSSIRLMKKEKILFPYFFNGKKLEKYNEKQFEKNFPCAVQYLSQYKQELGKRHADKNAKWFEYGRSQLLAHVNQPKLLTSVFVTNKPVIYMLSSEVIPYAGICIVSKGKYPLAKAKEILLSDEFMNYVKDVGVCTNGGSYRISPRDINEYYFDRNFLEEN